MASHCEMNRIGKEEGQVFFFLQYLMQSHYKYTGRFTEQLIPSRDFSGRKALIISLFSLPEIGEPEYPNALVDSLYN